MIPTVIALLAPIWFLFCRGGGGAAEEDGDEGDEIIDSRKTGAGSAKADTEEEDEKVEPDAE